jgi:acetyltransferase-like isoleucine patch superfamily enzyme
MIVFKFIYKLFEFSYKGFNKIVIVPGLKASFGHCGKNVRIAYNVDIKGGKNCFIGEGSQIGPHSLFWTTRAKILIGNKVLMGPYVTIITGDHRTDVVGKHIIDVSDDEKLPANDADVIIHDGVWISSNVIILKGVTIGEGAVIAAGAVVTNDVEPYTIYAGVPARKIRNRFSNEQMDEHLKIMRSKL